MDIMEIMDIRDILDIMVIMDILDIMDIMDIMIISAWMAMAGAVSAPVSLQRRDKPLGVEDTDLVRFSPLQ